jgi:hypothetical protein
MAVTSHDFSDTLPLVAPAGGTTAGTVIFNTTTRNFIFPLETVTSGSTYIGKVRGLLKGVAIESVAAMAAGTPLEYQTATSNFGPVTSGTTATIQAWLAAPSVSTVLTGDIILTMPVSYTAP